MNALQTAQAYFEAWNRCDPDAINACFAEGGTYADPMSGVIRVPAIGGYAQELFSAFPDVQFELVSAAQTDENRVAAQWVMRGTNLGSLQGAPPTGKLVELPGADFITVEEGGLRSVIGYFDSGLIPRQLGMQVLVQPHSIGPLQFGYSTYMNAGSRADAGAISVTILQVNSPQEEQMVRDYSRRIVGEMAQMPGFISFLGAVAGDRMFTVTAWEDEESPAQLLKGGTHREAMQRFFGAGFTRGGVTSVLTPGRIGIRWARCESCGKMADSRKLEGLCSCGAELPSLRYW